MQYKHSRCSDAVDKEQVSDACHHTPSVNKNTASKKASVSSSETENRSSAKSTPQLTTTHTVTPKTRDDKVSLTFIICNIYIVALLCDMRQFSLFIN